MTTNSPAGTVRVMRTVYRKTVRNGDTIDPVSVRAGVVTDGWLPHTARAMAHLVEVLHQACADRGRRLRGEVDQDRADHEQPGSARSGVAGAARGRETPPTSGTRGVDPIL